MNTKDILKLQIDGDRSLIAALKQMDSQEIKLLLVMNERKFDGLVSIGDIQRHLIKNGNIDATVNSVRREKILVGSIDDSEANLKRLMLSRRLELLPLVNSSGELVDVLRWEDYFSNTTDAPSRKLENLQVVIMAGGLGTRLKPLTNIIPKPLIPIGEKSTIERIIDQFHVEGCRDFFATVNYKAEMIRFYFSELQTDYELKFVSEMEPLGTGGSLSLLKAEIKNTFFVTNCDILIDAKMSDILDYHRAEKNKITIVSAIHTNQVPYGVLKTGKDGRLVAMEEKPEQIYQVNTGVYILEPEVLEHVPIREFIHITDIIQQCVNVKMKVGVYPVSGKSWMDIGQWKEYIATARLFGDKFE